MFSTSCTLFPHSNNPASSLEESRLYLNSYSKSSVAQQVSRLGHGTPHLASSRSACGSGPWWPCLKLPIACKPINTSRHNGYFAPLCGEMNLSIVIGMTIRGSRVMRSIIVTLLLSSQLDLSCNFSVRQLKGYSSHPLKQGMSLKMNFNLPSDQSLSSRFDSGDLKVTEASYLPYEDNNSRCTSRIINIRRKGSPRQCAIISPMLVPF